jgi:hypothetical protein
MNVETGTETPIFLSGNICFEIAVFCLCSVPDLRWKGVKDRTFSKNPKAKNVPSTAIFVNRYRSRCPGIDFYTFNVKNTSLRRSRRLAYCTGGWLGCMRSAEASQAGAQPIPDGGVPFWPALTERSTTYPTISLSPYNLAYESFA